MRSQISTGGSAIFIAVLPEAARSSNSTEDVVRYLQQNVGEPGTYAAIVGNQFRSTSQSAATNAFQTSRATVSTRSWSQFVTNVRTIDSGGTVTTPSGSQSTESGSALVPLLVLGVWPPGCRRAGPGRQAPGDKANAMSLAAVKSTVDEDITAFGESLDSVDSSAINTGENRADWMAALDQYDKAKRSSEAMKTPAEAATVTEALDEGRFRWPACRHD